MISSSTAVIIAGSLLATILTIIGTGIAYLVQAAQNGQISYHYHLWYWCLFYNIFLVIFAIDVLGHLGMHLRWSFGKLDVLFVPRWNNQHNLLDMFGILPMIIGFSIWSIAIMSALGIDSNLYYTQLWVWFQVVFWVHTIVVGCWVVYMYYLAIVQLIVENMPVSQV